MGLISDMECRTEIVIDTTLFSFYTLRPCVNCGAEWLDVTTHNDLPNRRYIHELREESKPDEIILSFNIERMVSKNVTFTIEWTTGEKAFAEVPWNDETKSWIDAARIRFLSGNE